MCIRDRSAAKIEKIYVKDDRSSIESNFGNQFFGLTKDIEALKSYPLVFGKEERQRVSLLAAYLIQLPCIGTVLPTDNNHRINLRCNIL